MENTHPVVRAFNQCPRCPRLPVTLNAWYFGVNHLELSGAAVTFLFIINPYSRVTYVERLSLQFHAKSGTEKAKEVANRLLQAFAEGAHLLQYRPWAWCADAGTRALMGNILRDWGVEGGLDFVRLPTESEGEVVREAWGGILRCWVL